MAYVRRILIDPEPVLRKVAKKVTGLELKMPLTQQLIDDMFETMYSAPGIGLAAPQVGVSKRIIVVHVGEDERYAVINPVLSDFEGEETGIEGCLSIPGKVGDVKRAAACTVTGLDRHGKKIELRAQAMVARCFQHEVDHLDGVLITDKATNMRDAVPVEVASSDAAEAPESKPA